MKLIGRKQQKVINSKLIGRKSNKTHKKEANRKTKQQKSHKKEANRKKTKKIIRKS